MSATKKFLVGLLVALTLIFSAVAHAEEIDPYFSWEIKNLDDYRNNDFLFKAIHDDGVFGIRDTIYRWINEGKYSLAAKMSGELEARQKVSFGPNFFDAALTELIAKLYFETGELDAAELKINFLSNNATDNVTKIRALNLKSDLFNRRENYSEALNVTQEVDELLNETPDENLNLINQARAARAYCGLGDTKKSLTLAENLLPSMQKNFGESGYETFALTSTLAENYCKVQDYDNAMKILAQKVDLVNEDNQKNLVVRVKTYLETIPVFFALNDTESVETTFDAALNFLTDCDNSREKFILCKEINDAARNLPAENPVALKSELALMFTSKVIDGNISYSIELCKKNLPKFKKVFGEQSKETYLLMSCLKDNYFTLGKYSDEKKVAEEMFAMYKKNFGEDDELTVESKIALADVYCRMGKYKTADKLLDDIQNQYGESLEKFPDLMTALFLAKAKGARMRGDIYNAYDFLDKIAAITPDKINDEADNESNKLFFMSGLVTNPFELYVIRLTKSQGNENHPDYLKMFDDLAAACVAYGNFTDAERYVKQIRLRAAHFGENNFYEWSALNTLAKIRRAQGNFSEALEIDNRALKIAENVCGKKSLERMQSLDSIASDHASAGNFVEAIKIREKTLSEYKKILEDTDALTVQMMTNLAEDYVAAKRYADAVKLCDETLAVQKNPVYENDRLCHFPSVTELIRVKATAQKLSGDEVNAYSNYKELIQVYEAKRFPMTKGYVSILSDPESKSRWFAGVVPVYKDAVAVAASDKVDDKNFVFYCTELCKGRNLIDHFDDVLVAKNYLFTADEKQRLTNEQTLSNACRAVAEFAAATNDDALLFEVEALYTSSRVSANIFKGELREKYSDNMIPKDVQATGDENPESLSEKWANAFDWDEILKNFDVKKTRQAIPDGACLVEFMKVSDDSLVVTFLRNDGDVQAANIPVDKNFFAKCKYYHELNAEFNLDGTDAELNSLRQKLSVELSEKLMPTLEKFAGNSTHWIISPDAELNVVPFETLIFRDKLLIESVDVSYVPSLAVMNLMKNRERKNSYLGRSKELFAMGDAVYGNIDAATSRGSQQKFFESLRGDDDEKNSLAELRWNNLPGTAQELDKVSPLFDSKAIFRREQATEKNLRELNSSGELAKYKYLLFAAHGLFVPKSTLSAIVLSQQFTDGEHDGYVTVGEWMGYDLRSDLIYLSACESGRGDELAGEGIVGIPYALTVAGNKDTVMSLWKVDDTATAEFTSAVFEKLSRGLSEVSALNETKREFLRHENSAYKNPSVWAAFVLYGI